eukprot:SAG11_NODE_137_length_15114_cov_2.297303_6_plen_165_part_00
MVLGLSFVYYYRLPCLEDRQGYWTALRCGGIVWRRERYEQTGWDRLGRSGVLQNILIQVQKKFVDHMELEPGIAMNEALQENLFVLTIGILNRYPFLNHATLSKYLKPVACSTGYLCFWLASQVIACPLFLHVSYFNTSPHVSYSSCLRNTRHVQDAGDASHIV